MISPEDAALLLHKFITESSDGVVAFFVSSGGEVRTRLVGRLSIVPGAGLAIICGDAASLNVESAALRASTFEYDSERGREGLRFESGLCIMLPSGARLTLLESKSTNVTP